MRYPLTPPSKYMTFQQWTSKLALELVQVKKVRLPSGATEEKWRKWVYSLMLNPSFSMIPKPTELIYPGIEGWRKWGHDFVNNFPISIVSD